MASVPASSIYRTAERLVPGGDLQAWLAERVAAGDSCRMIAVRLQDHNVIVSHDAVNDWLHRLGLRAS